MFKRILTPILLVVTAFALSACEEDEASAIAAAQACLNEMNSTLSKTQLATKAAECRTLLGTPISAKGFTVLCSSFYLEEGFFGSKILEAFNRIDDTSNDSSFSLMSVFAFNSESNATSANNACQQTGVKTLQVFGDVTVAATTIGKAFPGGLDALVPDDGTPPSTADFEAALDQIDTAEEFEALASSVISLSNNLCSSEKDNGFGEDVCPTLETITASSDSATIGNCMQQCMKNGKGHQCTADTSITCP